MPSVVRNEALSAEHRQARREARQAELAAAERAHVLLTEHTMMSTEEVEIFKDFVERAKESEARVVKLEDKLHAVADAIGETDHAAFCAIGDYCRGEAESDAELDLQKAADAVDAALDNLIEVEAKFEVALKLLADARIGEREIEFVEHSVDPVTVIKRNRAAGCVA